MSAADDPQLPHADSVVQAVGKTFQSACNVRVRPLDEPGKDADGAMIFAILTLGREKLWAAFLGLPAQTAVKVAESFAGFEIEFDSNDMGDAIKELANLFSQQLKRLLHDTGVQAEVTLPAVLRAEGLQAFVDQAESVHVSHFQSRLGSLCGGVIAA